MKLLLHVCCAPCSAACVKSLRAETIEPELFWYNPNIHLYTEYEARRNCLSSFAAEEALNLTLIDEYGLRRFISGLPPDTFKPGADAAGAFSRCAYCYRTRLEKTAAAAVEKSCEAFSTTLLISPYQDHELLKKTGEDCAAKYGVKFLYRDFRVLFRNGQKEARERGFYMQKYCGCVFSEEERYLRGKK